MVPTHLAQPVVEGRSAHASLMDALAVAEFLAAFGVLCEASVLRLQQVQTRLLSVLPCVLLRPGQAHVAKQRGPSFPCQTRGREGCAHTNQHAQDS